MVVTTLACPNSSCTVAPAFFQVSQKGFNILSGSLFQRFFWQKIGEVSRPVHIEWRTIRPNPVFLRACPISFPKRTALSGIGDIHHLNRGTLFDFKRLGKGQAFNTRRNYYIII
jgi:hypothetical protein